MLFAKLFGGREPEKPASTTPVYSQPAAVPPLRPQAVASQVTAAPAAVHPGATPLKVENPLTPTAAGDGESRGFDPYNSGAFNKSRAWEKINRR